MFTEFTNGVEEGLMKVADKALAEIPSSTPTESRAGQRKSADKATRTVPVSAPVTETGQRNRADEAMVDAPVSVPLGEMGVARLADKATERVPVSPLIDQLAELQVRRKFYIGVVNKQSNAAKALVRRALGWRYDEEDGDREKVNGRAARIVAAALSGKDQKEEDAAIFGVLAFDLATVAAAISPCTKARHEIELEMRRVVRKLPVYQWAKDVKGLGELGLAVIIAEAGDLSGYPKKGHLWKRLGMAPFEGQAYSTWRMKGGLSADDWTDAGYSPRRRAEIYAVVSAPMFRAQTVAQGPYRAVYDRRRELTAGTHPDWTKAHSHMDGLRIMTKYMLRDLWQAWKGGA